jgi:hypothetical protein
MSTVTMSIETCVALRECMAGQANHLRGDASTEYTRRDIAIALDDWANLLNEAISAERDLGTDYQALLAEVVERVGLYTGGKFTATADEHGAQAAIEALESAAPCVAPPVDDRDAWLSLMREASRALPIAVTVEVGAYTTSTKKSNGGGWRSMETILMVPVLRVPVLNESLVLEDGRRVRVCAPPEHDGLGVVLRCNLLSTPKPVEDF